MLSHDRARWLSIRQWCKTPKNYRILLIYKCISTYQILFWIFSYFISSEEHFRTCAHGRTYPHVRMWGAVRNFCNFYCAGGVRCGMVKEMPPHPHFNGGKNLGKFLSIFPNFSKNVFPHRTVPHNSFKKFLRTATHPTSLFFFASTLHGILEFL